MFTDKQSHHYGTPLFYFLGGATYFNTCLGTSSKGSKTIACLLRQASVEEGLQVEPDRCFLICYLDFRTFNVVSTSINFAPIFCWICDLMSLWCRQRANFAPILLYCDSAGLFAKFRMFLNTQICIPPVLLIQDMYSLRGLYIIVLEPQMDKQTERAIYAGD